MNMNSGDRSDTGAAQDIIAFDVRHLSEQQLAALSRDGHVKVPISILRLAASQFQALARDFANSGNVVSQAMCSASASTLDRVIESNSVAGLSLSRDDQSGR